MTKVILFRWCQTVTALVALLIMGSVFSVRAAERPNLVYILLDDAGFGDLGCYGQEKFATPHMDRLAAEGMRFTQHYSGCTVCAPTRCSLMTGMHTGHCYIRGNREIKPEGQEPLE
ncbi:MAG: sulfatase-like hydrolase/transferase, partial [Verrucomicrobiales bacterium]|nr:sulfatase-like hydrolase/transferase [Verrucomicrobiales bacterium]